MISIQSLGGYTVGQHVEAREVYQSQWRPARIVSFSDDIYGHGCYLQWLDIAPGDFSKSQGGWHPSARDPPRP